MIRGHLKPEPIRNQPIHVKGKTQQIQTYLIPTYALA
jgi:hypothetical protein